MAPSSTWERFSSLREACPGCEHAGYEGSRGEPYHNLCRRRKWEHGWTIQCASLDQTAEAPAGWKMLGDGALGTVAWSVRDGSPRPSTDRPPRPRRTPPPSDLPAASDDQLDMAYGGIRRALAAATLTNAAAAASFFASQGAEWHAEHYSVWPTRAEETSVLHRAPRPAAAIPGLTPTGLVRARRDPDAGYAEWTLDRDGRTVGMAVRFLVDTTGPKVKAHGPARVHHPAGWDALGSTIWITEGRRKANEVQRRRGEACLGFPGVAVGRERLAETLTSCRAAGATQLILAPDMADLMDGEQRHDQVRRAVLGPWNWLSRRVHAATGAEVLWATWDHEAAKGIDDALAADLDVEFVPWDAYLDRWRWDSKPEHLTRSPVATFTVAPVRDIGEAAGRIGELARSWRVGEESLAVASFPGASKTTAFGLDLLRRLESGEVEAAVLALPTRDLVKEKADAMRGRRPDLAHMVLEVLGAGANQADGFWCQRPHHRRSRASLGRWGCEGCHEVRPVCQAEPGRFRHDQAFMRMKLSMCAKGSPLLVITTQDKLRYIHRHLPDGAAIVIDDVHDAGFGLIDEQTRDVDDLGAAAGHLETFLSDVRMQDAWGAFERDGSVAGAIVAKGTYEALQSILGDGDVAAELESAASMWSPKFVDLVKAGTIRAERDGWDWERPGDGDGADLRPAATTLAGSLFRAVLHGHRPTVYHSGRSVRLLIPDVDLIARVKAGRVAWLSVGPMPDTLAETLGVRIERVEADPRHLRTLAIEGRTMGVRLNTTVQAVVDAIGAHTKNGGLHYAGHTYRSAGAVVRKRARADLEMELVRHYGAGHAATDDLSAAEVLVVSRYALPTTEIRRQAETISRAFGLPAVAAGQREEWVGWAGHRPHRKCPVYIDPTTFQVEMFHAEQSQLNAVGRCRPLSADGPRLVVILAGIPFGGVRVDDVVSLEDLCLDLDLVIDVEHYESAKRDRAERDAVRMVHQAETILEAFKGYVEDHGVEPSHRELAKRAKLAKTTVQRAIREPGLSADIRAFLSVSFAAHEAVLTSPSLNRVWAANETARNSRDRFPSASLVAEAVGCSKATAARHIRAWRLAEESGEPPLPARSDAKEASRAVLATITAWREKHGMVVWGIGPVYGEN